MSVPASEDHAITSNSAIQGSGGSKGRKMLLKAPSRGSPDVKERMQGGNENFFIEAFSIWLVLHRRAGCRAAGQTKPI